MITGWLKLSARFFLCSFSLRIISCKLFLHLQIQELQAFGKAFICSDYNPAGRSLCKVPFKTSLLKVEGVENLGPCQKLSE